MHGDQLELSHQFVIQIQYGNNKTLNVNALELGFGILGDVARHMPESTDEQKRKKERVKQEVEKRTGAINQYASQTFKKAKLPEDVNILVGIRQGVIQVITRYTGSGGEEYKLYITTEYEVGNVDSFIRGISDTGCAVRDVHNPFVYNPNNPQGISLRKKLEDVLDKSVFDQLRLGSQNKLSIKN
jgi:hypothetical protein